MLSVNWVYSNTSTIRIVRVQCIGERVGVTEKVTSHKVGRIGEGIGVSRWGRMVGTKGGEFGSNVMACC